MTAENTSEKSAYQRIITTGKNTADEIEEAADKRVDEEINNGRHQCAQEFFKHDILLFARTDQHRLCCVTQPAPAIEARLNVLFEIILLRHRRKGSK